MGMDNYNPVTHERGCHTKLNWLAKESLQFRPMRDQRTQMTAQAQLPSQISKQLQPHSNKNSSCLNSPSFYEVNDSSSGVNLGEDASLWTPGKTTIENDKRHRGPTGSGARQDGEYVSPIQAHSKTTNNISTGSMSQQSKKDMLPLHSCPRPSQNQVSTPRSMHSRTANQMEAKKPTTEPPMLKANFRRIKQGRLNF